MQEAAARWADVIKDSHMMRIEFLYSPESTGADAEVMQMNILGNRTTVGRIRFSDRTDRVRFFDPTPADDKEYTFAQTLYGDLTQAAQESDFNINTFAEPLLEVGYRGFDNGSNSSAHNARDMLSVALHEIGHLMGVTGLPSAIDRTRDGDYDISPQFLAGAGMAIATFNGGTAHLQSPLPSMSGWASPFGSRTLISATDVFAAANASDWTEIDLDRKDFLFGTNWNTAANWAGSRVPDSLDQAFVRNGGSVQLSANAAAQSLTVGVESSVSTAGRQLQAIILNIDAAGRVNVNGGSLLSQDVFLKSGGILAITSGLLAAKNLNHTAGGSLRHTGGELLIDDGTFSSATPMVLAGEGNPVLRMVNASAAATDRLQLGGVEIRMIGDTALRIPLSGELRLLSQSEMTTTGVVVLGADEENSGAGLVSLDNGNWDVDGDIIVAPRSSASLSRLTLSNSSQLTAKSIRVNSTGRFSVNNSSVTTKDFFLSSPAVLSHTGGRITVDGGEFDNGRGELSLAGTASTALHLINRSIAETGNILLGGALTFCCPASVTPSFGQLRIESESVMHSTGDATIGGAHSSNPGTGTATINNAIWDVSGTIRLAPIPSQGTSQVTVDNSGQLFASTIDIGTTSGRLNVYGGKVTTHNLYLRAPNVFHHLGGEVIIDGGNFESSGAIHTGGFGVPVLRITNNAIATVPSVSAGYLGLGSIEVTAGAQLSVADNFFVGGDAVLSGGIGTVSIEDGATLDVGSTLKIWNVGAFDLSGGTLSADTIDNDQGGAFIFAGGRLSVDDFRGTLLQEGGTLAPGNSIGTTIIRGDFMQTIGSRIEIEIQVEPSVAADRLFVTGMAQFAGELQLRLLDNALPSATDVIYLISSIEFSGSFSNVANGERLVTADGRGSFLVHYGHGSSFDPAQVVLTQFSLLKILPGDYNRDGTVNTADYVIWRKGLSTTYTEGEYSVWRANFGSTSPSTGSGELAPVPEPSALVLACFAIAIASRMAAVLKTQRQ